LSLISSSKGKNAFGLLDPEDEGSWILQNVRKNSLNKSA
jgi:hypothetical protein